jgi:protease-4
VRTTPLSGQPDLVGGFTPEVEAILQKTIENGYREFVARVASSRRMTPARVDEIGQGRVWDGGTARQLGLVDQYGGIDDALEWVAAQAKLGKGEWHAKYLGQDARPYDSLLRRLLFGDTTTHAAVGLDVFGHIAQEQSAIAARVAADVERLTGERGMQAYCLECPMQPAPRAAPLALGPLARLIALIAG